MLCQRAETPELFAGIETIRKLMLENFGETKHERLITAHLDVARCCVHTSLHSGSEFSVNFPFREIIQDVLTFESKELVLSHNHPSMICRPSFADIAVTRRLCDMLAPLNVRIFDHLIVAGSEVFSFRGSGLL